MIISFFSVVPGHPTLIALSLLGIAGLFPEVSLGFHEDYYMQELLSREHYYRLPVPEESAREGHELSTPPVHNKPKTSGKPAGGKTKSGNV